MKYLVFMPFLLKLAIIASDTHNVQVTAPSQETLATQVKAFKESCQKLSKAIKGMTSDVKQREQLLKNKSLSISKPLDHAQKQLYYPRFTSLFDKYNSGAIDNSNFNVNYQPVVNYATPIAYNKISRNLSATLSNMNNNNTYNRRLYGGTTTSPTIINIPVPKITETELEVVHVFPSGMYGGYPNYSYGGGGSGGNYNPAANFIPSYSINTTLNGEEKVDNFYGFTSPQ